MPKANVHRADHSQKDGVENRILEACKYLRDHKSVVITAAAATLYDVPYHTLRRRCQQLNSSARDGQRKRMILTKIQEDILVTWLQFWSTQGISVGREGIQLKVEGLTGRRPCLKWVDRFRKRHREELAYSKNTPSDITSTRSRMSDSCVLPALEDEDDADGLVDTEGSDSEHEGDSPTDELLVEDAHPAHSSHSGGIPGLANNGRHRQETMPIPRSSVSIASSHSSTADLSGTSGPLLSLPSRSNPVTPIAPLDIGCHHLDSQLSIAELLEIAKKIPSRCGKGMEKGGACSGREQDAQDSAGSEGEEEAH